MRDEEGKSEREGRTVERMELVGGKSEKGMRVKIQRERK